MNKNILVWSLKRSGAHGFESWLFPHIGKGNYVFFNNVSPKGAFCHSRTEEDGDKTLIFGIEDYELNEEIAKKAANAKDTVHVLVLRDLFNLVASRLKKSRGPKKDMPIDSHTISLWKSYAREFIGETNIFPEKVCVSFNRWFEDLQYRKSLSSKLGYEFTDEGKDQLGARPSSFDHLVFRKNASQMNVIDRWRQFVSDTEYLRICRDEEAINMSKIIFALAPQSLLQNLK